MILPVVTQFLVDTLMGNYWMLMLSSFAYRAVSLSFLTKFLPYYCFIYLFIFWSTFDNIFNIVTLNTYEASLL